MKMMMMMGENQSSQSKVYVTAFSGYRGFSGKKSVKIGYSVPLCVGGWTQFSPNTSQVIQKQTVKETLAKGHQADLASWYKFHILRRICSTQYFTLLFWDWGKRQKARIDSRRYKKTAGRIKSWIL
jgi:hypothetical protein